MRQPDGWDELLADVELVGEVLGIFWATFWITIGLIQLPLEVELLRRWAGW